MTTTDPSPLDTVFEELFGYLDEQIAEDMLQMLLRTSYLDYAKLMSPHTYRVTMRVAIADLFEVSSAIRESIAEDTRKSANYKKVRENLIRIRQDLSDPKSWIESTQETYLQNRAFGRQYRMALTSKNENAVTKALDSLSERMAPAIKNQQPVLHITIGQDDLKREEETTKMVTSGGKLIEGEVVS